MGNIPVTRIRVPLLMGDGGQDAVSGLRGSGQHHHGRTARLPRPRAATNLYYPGAGHYYFGVPPYFPVFTNTEVARLGGSAQADALATEQFWTRTITFLNHLAVHQPTHS